MAEKTAHRIESAGAMAADMRPGDCAAWARAAQLLAPTGTGLEVAAGEYARAIGCLGGVPLATAVDYYVRRHSVVDRPVSDIVNECVTAKGADGLSARHIDDLRSRLNRFASDFQCSMQSVTGERIRLWLDALRSDDAPLSPRTRNNYRLAIQTLVSWCIARRYLPRGWDEMDAVPVTKEPHSPPSIFTPAELDILLTACPSPLLPLLAIGAFAGLRTAEIERLQWSQVRWDADCIEVSAAQSKTGQRRLVPILPALRGALTPHAARSGPVNHVRNTGNALGHLGRSVGGWRNNGLRHSWISYRVAATNDVARVALEAGNSPKVIHQSYRELVTADDAAAWFAERLAR